MEFQKNNYQSVNKQVLEEEVLKFTLGLYRKSSIPRKVVQELVEEFSDFIANIFVPYLDNTLRNGLKQMIDNFTDSKIQVILNENKHPFSAFSTEYLRFQIYEKRSVFNHPEEFTIGIDDATNKPVTAVHVPLKKTLKIFLNLPGIYKAIEDHVKFLKTETKIISNYIQGETWKNKYSSDNENRFPLTIFFDDIETGNSLGSHSGEKKFGMVYASLPCLPPHIASKLTNIFLVTIFHSHHRNIFGNDKVFEELILDLTCLSKEGIDINVNGDNRTIYFDCVLIVGDNLGMNSTCGFTESFTSDIYCRICRANSKQCQKLTTEAKSLLRTKKNYMKNVSEKSEGIRNECVFNKIPNFHIIENQAVDLMHDVFEGVARDVIENVLTTLIFVKKYFSLQEVNEKIDLFEYGEIEKSNKPRFLTTEKCNPSLQDILGCSTKIKAKQSAAEMVCLSRYLGLILGDLIPEKSKHWALYVLLRKIIGFVTAPYFVQADIYTLEHLIEKHHNLYIKLYGNLKPKAHMMTHIPRIMLKNGPLINFWGMKFERKHKYYKDIVATNSNVNLPKTIAIRNQLELSCRAEFTTEIEKIVILGPIEKEDASLEIKLIKKNLPKITTAKSYKYINIYGKIFANGTVFVKSIKENEPEFVKLKKVYVVNGEVYLYSCSLEIIHFNINYHAYEVKNNDIPKDFLLVDKCIFPPCLFVNVQSKYYVATRFEI